MSTSECDCRKEHWYLNTCIGISGTKLYLLDNFSMLSHVLGLDKSRTSKKWSPCQRLQNVMGRQRHQYMTLDNGLSSRLQGCTEGLTNKRKTLGVSIVASGNESNSYHEDVGSIPGLAQWVKDLPRAAV